VKLKKFGLRELRFQLIRRRRIEQLAVGPKRSGLAYGCFGR
jgi:hypothetical protein